jgi:cell division protein FtsQ
VRLSAITPSGGAVLVGLGILAVGFAGYAAARETSAFAVREVRVEGATPALARQIRATLRPVVGESLVALDGDGVLSRAESLPGVLSAGYDRAFPHTLVVRVRRERPAAVLRRGAESWLVSARGRFLKQLRRGAHPRLPRIWVPRSVGVSAGGLMSDPDARRAVLALSPLAGAPLPARVRSVRATPEELTFALAGGLELRLGDESDLHLKLAVAREILPLVGSGPCYLDVSVPERPVACGTLNSQVEVEG